MGNVLFLFLFPVICVFFFVGMVAFSIFYKPEKVKVKKEDNINEL